MSRRRIYYWRKIGLLPKRISGVPRGYSFSELLSIKVIAKLKSVGMRVGQIGKALDAIKNWHLDIKNALTEKTVFVHNRQVCIIANGQVYEARTGQALLFNISDYQKELRSELRKYSEGRFISLGTGKIRRAK